MDTPSTSSPLSIASSVSSSIDDQVERIVNEYYREILDKSQIIIPDRYFTGMIETGLINSLIELIKEIDQAEEQISSNQSNLKRPYEQDTDENQDSNESIKRKKIEKQECVSTQTSDIDLEPIFVDHDYLENNNGELAAGYSYFTQAFYDEANMPSLAQTILKLNRRQQELMHKPSFTPRNNYEIYLINRSTDINVLHHIIYLAQTTYHITVDTESDVYTNRPALIQIEFIHEQLSTVILVEACHLPIDKQSLVFWLIRSIFKYILQQNKTIYCWGDAEEEFEKFLVYELYTDDMLKHLHMINIQDEFKDWHYIQVGYYETENDKWGLQKAIYVIYDEFLDKSQRLNKWSRGLYRHNNKEDDDKISSMICYATNDCLSVTKLAVTIHQLIKHKEKRKQMAMNDTNTEHIPSLNEQYHQYLQNYISKSTEDQQQQSDYDNLLTIRPFQPLKSFRICPIHHLTSFEHLLPIVELCHNTQNFSIDTERKLATQQLIRIKIELVQVEQIESIVLYLEVLNLFLPDTPLFSIVQKLLKNIFLPGKKIFVWSNENKEDLQTLVQYKFLSESILNDTNIMELQAPFKQWYNKTFKHNTNCNVPSSDTEDSCCCTCPYRPYKNMNDKWALQKAINHVFNEFISKSYGSHINYLQNIIYSIHRCLAITKLSNVIELDWTMEQLHQFKKCHQ
ncbi:unnamed protein product, partial [Rotaria sordida]